MRLTCAFEYASKRWKQQKAEDQLRQEEMTKEQEDEMDALLISESSDRVDEQQRQQEECTQERAPNISPDLMSRLIPPRGPTQGGADEAEEMNTLSVTESGDKAAEDQEQQEEKVQLTISPTKARHGEAEKYHMPEKVQEKEAMTSSLSVAHTEANKADHDKDQKQTHQGEEQQRKPNTLTTFQDEATKAQRHEREAEHKGEEQKKALNAVNSAARKTDTSAQNLKHFITIRVWSTKERKWTTVQRPTVSQ